MASVVQSGLAELLEEAGARIRGRNRADCPECERFRAVSFTETAFFCHGAACEFHGGIATLRKRLGVSEWLPREVYLRQKRERARAHEAATRLYCAVHARRMELLTGLHSVARLEALAHDAGMDDETAWDRFALVCRERPLIEFRLDFLESASAADTMRFLTMNPRTRHAAQEGGLLCESSRSVTAIVAF